MNLDKLINGALIGALIGVGISATSDTSQRFTQKHLKGYDNLDGDGANLAFKVQTEFGEEATARLIKRMDSLAALAAVMEVGTDTDMEVILATADRAHHVHDRIQRHVNNLMAAEDQEPEHKETLTHIMEWAQCHSSNIDVLVRQRGGVTTPPVPCEYDETKVPEPPAPPASSGLMGFLGKMMGGMMGAK